MESFLPPEKRIEYCNRLQTVTIVCCVIGVDAGLQRLYNQGFVPDERIEHLSKRLGMTIDQFKETFDLNLYKFHSKNTQIGNNIEIDSPSLRVLDIDLQELVQNFSAKTRSTQTDYIIKAVTGFYAIGSNGEKFYYLMDEPIQENAVDGVIVDFTHTSLTARLSDVIRNAYRPLLPLLPWPVPPEFPPLWNKKINVVELVKQTFSVSKQYTRAIDEVKFRAEWEMEYFKDGMLPSHPLTSSPVKKSIPKSTIEIRLDPTDEKILGYLKKRGLCAGRLLGSEIANCLHLNIQSIGKNLRKLISLELIDNKPRKGYLITKKGSFHSV